MMMAMTPSLNAARRSVGMVEPPWIPVQPMTEPCETWQGLTWSFGRNHRAHDHGHCRRSRPAYRLPDFRSLCRYRLKRCTRVLAALAHRCRTQHVDWRDPGGLSDLGR